MLLKGTGSDSPIDSTFGRNATILSNDPPIGSSVLQLPQALRDTTQRSAVIGSPSCPVANTRVIGGSSRNPVLLCQDQLWWLTLINLSFVVEAFASFTDWAQRRFAFPPQEVLRVVDFPPPGVATFSTTTSRSLALNSLSLSSSFHRITLPLKPFPPPKPSSHQKASSILFSFASSFHSPLLINFRLPVAHHGRGYPCCLGARPRRR